MASAMLTNVRCLSEGVDVPSLDAVLFLSARNSQVDVVQSVGRVMRRAEGKKYGYIIIPVVVPANVEADKALDDNERYKVVWTVLNALRAHDDRFNATVNKIELNRNRPCQIMVGGTEYGFDGDGNPVKKTDGDGTANAADIAAQLSLQFEQLQNVVFARMVQKVGDRRYWEQWAKSVAEIAQRQTERITKLIDEDARHEKEFEKFLNGLHQNINPSITKLQAIEMLSQHIITKPVFDALFEGYSFVKHNAISQSMQKMLDLLEEQSLEKDAETLQKFYESVKMRAAGIDNAEGKQRIIIELYDKFFKTAFPKMVEQLGIVYTPVEVVDFIIHSVNDILQKEFGRSISDENIHILDPFTGTGTFITRLLQSGLIREEDLERKYRHEIHANEIVLLAYYIAAVNIETAFHDATPDPDDGIGKEKYIPFDGIVLTDTFQLGETKESERLFNDTFTKNSERVQAQQKAPLRIIIGNPPYSVGQKSGNDNAQNQKYHNLDARVENTYAQGSKATSVKALYDSYIKAFRWSTDRLNENNENGGIVCFVSNGAWLDGNGMDGFRKSLEKEFTSIYVFNLRGNQRTSGELSRKEGGKIFGSGSRTPIAITLLVKNPKAINKNATIHYHDIGDYLKTEEKLKMVHSFKSFITMPLRSLQPNEHGDWISMRNDVFSTFIALAPEKKFNKTANSIFIVNSLGLNSNRDAWVYNSSQKNVLINMNEMVGVYNSQVKAYTESKKRGQNIKSISFIETDPKLISWSSSLVSHLERENFATYEPEKTSTAAYRPFFKQYLYHGDKIIHRKGQFDELFPPKSLTNLVICVSGVGVTKEFSTLITDIIPDLEIVGKTQYFPLYYYEENSATQNNLFDANTGQQYTRRDAISDFILKRAVGQYGKNVTKEDIFYYVYGFLHSKDYRETFANDLKKMLPRLPLVEDVRDFWKFSKAGRQLAELHLNYESVPPAPGVIVLHNPLSVKDSMNALGTDEVKYVDYEVQKMRYPKKGQTETIIYNSRITVDNIPAKAYEYVVNGKSAIDWIMERYQVTVHKDSGIKNDPNDWAKEHNNPRYILDLLLSVINVSVQTVDIVEGLPKVSFE